LQREANLRQDQIQAKKAAELKASMLANEKILQSMNEQVCATPASTEPFPASVNDSLRRFHEKFGSDAKEPIPSQTPSTLPYRSPESSPILPKISSDLSEIKHSLPKYFSESGLPLRGVQVPACIIDKFLQIAGPNTRSNLETCGVLAGKLQHDTFTITALIVPKQTATSDTCAMSNEEEIVETQDRLDVLSLGWIHV